MDIEKACRMLMEILREVTDQRGFAVVERFNGLRDVDAKVREVKMILEALPPGAQQLAKEMENDEDFSANSRRVRLEALANYCKTALKFLNTGVIQQEKVIPSPPDVRKLTVTMPELDAIIGLRWIEAQKCRNAGAHLSAIIMMGSILEALLLARASMSYGEAYKCSRAPKTKESKSTPIQDWNLATLIDVAVELGWLKVDRGKFSHALRESRNIVHPWAQIASKADFDSATCTTCWHVLNASVDDLLKSI